jgi:tetratricopeptide (TPR) repeat protein
MKSFLSILIILMGSLNIFAQDKAETFIKEGVELHDAGKYDDAIVKFEAAIKLEPKNYTAHYEIANTYVTQKNFKKALKHADIATNAKDVTAGLAFILIGNVKDMDGNPKDAIKSYKSALKIMPDNYNLYYNMAITQINLQQVKEAEEALFSALRLKPSHPSSHYVLGIIAYDQQKNTKALLALYSFLMYEPKSARSKNAIKIINAITARSATKTDKGFNINLNTNDNDDFSAADLILSMSKITTADIEKTLKDSLKVNLKTTEATDFVKTNKMIFSFFQESKEKNKTVWWNLYGNFYGALSKKEYSEVFSYYISQSKADKEVKEWLSKNDDKVKDMAKWIGEYEFSF